MILILSLTPYTQSDSKPCHLPLKYTQNPTILHPPSPLSGSLADLPTLPGCALRGQDLSHAISLFKTPLRAPTSVQRAPCNVFTRPCIARPVSSALLQPQWPPRWLRLFGKFSSNFHPGPLPGCLPRCGSSSHFLYTRPSALVKLLSRKSDVSVVFILLSRSFIHSPGHLTHHIFYLFIIILFTTRLFPPWGRGIHLIDPR